MNDRGVSLREIVTVGLCGIAVVAVMYVSYLSGVRRVQHDTQLYTYAARAFLSDCLHNRIFPMWDPFSNMGIAMGAAPNHSIYNPLALLSTGLVHYTVSTVAFEFALTALIGLYGAYAWLRYQGISAALAFAGAVAYAGGPGLFNVHMCYPASLSPALLPWLLFAAETVVLGESYRERWLGIIVGAICPWMLFVGGYLGLVLMLLPFAFVYVGALIFLHRERYSLGRLARIGADTAAMVALAFALVFLPLSEFLLSYYGHFDELRKSYTENFTPYLGSLAYDAPLSVFAANGSGLGLLPGSTNMYIGAALVFLVPVLLLSRKLTAREYLLLGLAVFTAAASMGERCPIAVFCVKFVPGFKTSRWHYFFACVPMLFLITFVIRGVQLLLDSDWSHDPQRVRRAGIVVLASLAAVVIGAIVYNQTAVAATPLVLTTYELVLTAALVLAAGASMAWWLWRGRTACGHVITHIAIKAVSLPLIIFALLALGSLLEGDQLNRLDAMQSNVSPLTLLWLDLGQTALFVGLLAALLFALPKRGTQWFALGLAMLLVGDMNLGMQRYLQGNTYWLTSQAPLTRDAARKATVDYDGNVRDLSTSYVTPPNWWIQRDFANTSLMRREPTYRSYNPFVDIHMIALCDRPEGFELCGRLIWFVPGEIPEKLEQFKASTAEPELLRTKLMANTMDVDIRVPAAGHVVFTDAWSRGWRATVNGEEVPVERTYDAVKSVRIPAGGGHIHFWYRPVYLKLGLALFAAAVLVMAYMAFRIVWVKPTATVSSGAA